MYPDDCLQKALGDGDWWEQAQGNQIERGHLVKAFIPHVDQIPYTFRPKGRKQADQHSTATLEVEPLRINAPRRSTDLPVAAMTLHDGELWSAYRAKKRPCLVLGTPARLIDKALTRGMPNRSTAPTVLVAPYYGVDQNNRRSGYKAAFVERVRHCEYAQFHWDKLPLSGGPTESLLRLDHLQPIGTHHNSYELTEFKLTQAALELIDEQLGWLIYGGVQPDSVLAMYRAEIEETFGE